MHLPRTRLAAVAALALASFVLTDRANAELFRVRAQTEELVVPGGGPVLAPPVQSYRQPIAPPVLSSPSIGPDVCCHVPCIKYRDHIGRRSCFACEPTMDMILEAPSPCGCCLVEIPVCVPVCCVEVPCVTGRHGLFGREIVNYTWKCGFRVKVVFDRHGDATVHYLD